MNNTFKLVWINITLAKSKNNLEIIIIIIIKFKNVFSENKKNHLIEVYS
jgi:hypothetical protein